MPNTTQTENIRCLIGYNDFGNLFKPHGEYYFHAFHGSDRAVGSCFDLDIFIGRFAEYLLRSESRYREIIAHTETPLAFTEQQFARIESLIDEHNARVQGLVARLNQEEAQSQEITQ